MMPLLRASLCALVLASTAVPLAGLAQSTDGYHSIQVLPVVVDSSSFATRITVRNPRVGSSIRITARYLPGVGTSQAGPLDCGYVDLIGDRTFASLRELCPALAAGSQFGMLVLTQTQLQEDSQFPNTDISPFSAFARVSNPAAIGFSIESFPAHTFTSARSVVTGIRRLAATPSSPAIQTNCFIGKLPDLSTGKPVVSTPVGFVINAMGNPDPIGSGSVNVAPGQLVRLLDVFSAAGFGFLDQNDARVEFSETGDGEPGLVTFCTVQDNSSFGADFRIGKQEEGTSHALPGYFFGAQDDHVLRDTTVANSVAMSTGPGVSQASPFALPAGNSAASHLFYFRHPDFVQCEIIDPATGARALPGYGLELRLLASDGITVIAGGDGVQGFSRVYLGDKADRDEGTNSRYTLEVESMQALGAPTPYQLRCRSGSGHSLGELLRVGPGDRF